jgi:hypothetical protein
MDSLSNKEHERLLLMSEHGIAPPLSPAASAVWRAFQKKYSYPEDIDEYNVSAAIRAAADQLDHAASAHTLYAIATELDGTNDGPYS